MKKGLFIFVVLMLSVTVFTGCTKTKGKSASTVNPKVTVTPPVDTTEPTTQDTTEVAPLEEGNTIEDLEKDLNNTDFGDIDIEIDSDL